MSDLVADLKFAIFFVITVFSLSQMYSLLQAADTKFALLVELNEKV